jgi:hypothetical protein
MLRVLFQKLIECSRCRFVALCAIQANSEIEIIVSLIGQHNGRPEQQQAAQQLRAKLSCEPPGTWHSCTSETVSESTD